MNELFTTLTTALQGRFEWAFLAAFGWGVLSILLSPCHLSSIPLVIGYISSRKVTTVRRSIGLAFVFAVGILFTIALIGIGTASMGRLMGDVGRPGNWIVALVFLVVGLYLLDIIQLNWAGISVQHSSKKGLAGAFLLGLLFGIGLGPCTFAYMAPVLGVVFHIGQSNMLKAFLLIVAFAAGHCSVIVVAGGLSQVIQQYLTWSSQAKSIVFIRRVCGILVLLGGMYFVYTSLS